MKYEYSPQKLKKDYESEKYLKKKIWRCYFKRHDAAIRRIRFC